MTLVDDRERRMIRGEDDRGLPLSLEEGFLFERNIFVGAGAGSGKTTVLIQRMVALIRMGVPIQEIVAITFTRKAAGEMRGRFYRELSLSLASLRSALESTESPDRRDAISREADRVESALRRVEDVFIDTIHAFCARLLRERPFLAGLTPDFSMVEDRDERKMRIAFWDGYVRSKLDEQPEWMARLVDLGMEASVLRDYFGDRCGYGALQGPMSATEKPDLAEAVDDTIAYLDRIRDQMPAERPLDGITQEVERAQRFQRVHGFTSHADRARFLSNLDNLVTDDGRLKTNAVKVTSWGRKKADPARMVADTLKSGGEGSGLPSISEFVLSVVRPALVQWRTYVYSEMELFVRGAVREYAVHRKKEGKLTFDDLLRICSDTLRQSALARQWFGDRYRYLLVDEFQDTDPLQAEVLFYLCSRNRHEKDWTLCQPRDGSLFIVGDNKQSIYRFRHADLRVYNQCRDLIRSSGGVAIRLRTNFRSKKPICDFLNGALEPLFDGDSEPYQAKYEELMPFDAEAAVTSAVLQIPIDPVKGGSPVQIALRDAEEIARIIKALAERTSAGDATAGEGHDTDLARNLDIAALKHVSYGDCMILVRYARRLNLYAEALERAGIPYTMAGGKALHRTRMLSDLVNLVDAAHDPGNAIALLAYLRGPFAGISDTELYQYVEAGGSFSEVAPVPESLQHETREAFTHAFETVQFLRTRRQTDPVSQALDRLCSERGIFASCSLQRDGSAQAGAIFRVLALVRDWEADGLGWTEIREELHRLLDGELDADAMTLEVGTSNVVRLLNVHQAKGLESRIVFLADPAGHAGNRETESYVDRQSAEPLLYLPIRSRSRFSARTVAEPPGWKEAKEAEERFEEGERIRLLYVAATRAKEMLFISRYAGKETGVWQPLHAAVDARGCPSMLPFNMKAEPERRTADLEHMEEIVKNNEDALKQMALPSYTKSRASDVHDGDVETDVSADEWDIGQGRGRGYGRAVHRLFEHAVENRNRTYSRGDVYKLAQRFIEEEHAEGDDPSTDTLEAAVVGLEAFRNSHLWHEIMNADIVLTEVPFGLRRGDAETPDVLRGTIDLAYKTDGAWKIVDYKTDKGREDRVVEKYRPQIDDYAESWRTMLDESVREKGIWWVRNKQWIPIT